MNDFPKLAQSLSVALKALQMYTAAHPRSVESLATAHALLGHWLEARERLQVVVSGPKAFVDGQVQDVRSPHVAFLVRMITERGVSGFVFERGVSADEFLAFLEGLALKPAKLEELGGFERLLLVRGVTHIKVAQTRYQEVSHGEGAGPEDQAPALSLTPSPSPSPENLVKFIREALLASLAKGAPPASGTISGSHAIGGGSSSGSHAITGGSTSGSHAIAGGDAGSGSHAIGGGSGDGGQGLFSGFGPADLSGLGPLGRELGLSEGVPTPAQLGTLRQVLLGLSPQVQLGILAGLGSLPDQPAGLALGVKALAGELLAAATSSALAKGASWQQLRGPLQDILRPNADREAMVQTLVAHLRAAGQDASQAEAILRHLSWEALSLEAKLVKVLEEGHLFELSLEQRLALLREFLDLRRFDEFLRIQEVLLEALRSDRPGLRHQAVQTLTGVARWTLHPGLPSGSEGPLAEGLRAHFAWEPEPPLHRFTTDALELMLAALIHRGEFGHVISDLRELEGLCAFQEEQLPWRGEALLRIRTALLRPEHLDAVMNWAFALEREQVIQEVYPYLEFLGDPMARHLVDRLGEENDRARRGRLVEAVRSMGPTALPVLLQVLGSPAWFLVRNALTLLADLGDAGCLPPILPLLRHAEPRVRRTAVRALWKLGGPVAEPHLVAQMKDTDGETMQEVLFALGQLRSEASLPQVAELAKDKRVLERIRLQALDTLGHIASPRAMPVLLECLRRKGFFGGGESPAVRLAAARALVALGSPEALAALQQVVASEPKGEERETLRRLLERPVQP